MTAQRNGWRGELTLDRGEASSFWKKRARGRKDLRKRGGHLRVDAGYSFPLQGKVAKCEFEKRC